MGRIIPTLTALASLALAHPLPAASDGSPVNAPPTADASRPDTKENDAPEPLASRYHLGDVDSYIAAHAKTFAIRTLETDPFGLPQDPSKKPLAPKISPKTFNKYKNIPPTPFADVIAALKVNAVMPHQQRFLIASRTIRRGDKFPIVFQDKSISVEVLHIGGGRIDFRNTSTNETASLSLKLLPSGMNRDTGKASPPGLLRNDPDAPVEVHIPPPTSGASGVITRRNR